MKQIGAQVQGLQRSIQEVRQGLQQVEGRVDDMRQEMAAMNEALADLRQMAIIVSVFPNFQNQTVTFHIKVI